MDRKWMIIACFFSILTFISSVICSSLVFYNEKNRTEINSEKVLATNNIYKNTSIIYDNNNVINFSSVNTGFSTSKTFSIDNNNSDTIKYKIVWKDIVSTYNSDDLTYSLLCSNGEKIDNKHITNNDEENIIISSEITNNKTNNCTLTITYNSSTEEYEETAVNNNSFNAKYQIEVIE